MTATSVLPYNPTYGTRYLFADLEQRTFAMETRVDWTFTPSLSLQIYAQPLLSSGDYLQYKQLESGQTFKFIGLTPTNVSGLQNVDFDADGSTDFSFRDRDFNVRSLVGNAVLRWEYRSFRLRTKSSLSPCGRGLLVLNLSPATSHARKLPRAGICVQGMIPWKLIWLDPSREVARVIRAWTSATEATSSIGFPETIRR